MTIQEFSDIFETLAPSSIAWKNDNVGLQLGRPTAAVRNILVTLDVTAECILEAKRTGANLIVAHHPLLFHPQRTITDRTRVGSLSLALAEEGIALFAAHTNLDSVPWGVNGALSMALGLRSPAILSPLTGSLEKIAVYVPSDHADAVADAMHAAGAGMFARYDRCSFRSTGTGTFRGKKGSKPFIGTPEHDERVEETRIEMMCETWRTAGVVRAMLAAHPYEEAAYDVVPLANAHGEYGLGMIGTLPKPVSVRTFLARVKRALKTPALRYTPGRGPVHTVAVCGGSGESVIGDALRRGADALVTADLKYHTFQEHQGRLLLVDAGHYETERLVLPVLAGALREALRQRSFRGSVIVTRTSPNPVFYHS